MESKMGVIKLEFRQNNKFGRQRSNIYKLGLFEEIRKSETEITLFSGLRESPEIKQDQNL